MDIPQNKDIRAQAGRLLKEFGILKPIGAWFVACIVSSLSMMLVYVVMGVAMICYAISPILGEAVMVIGYFAAMLAVYAVFSVMYTGYFGYMIKIARGRQAHINDIFDGIKHNTFAKALVMIGLIIINLPAAIPLIPAVVYLSISGGSVAAWIIYAVLLTLCTVIMCIISAKYAFVMCIAGDEDNEPYSVRQIFGIAGKMSDGFKVRIFNMWMYYTSIVFAYVLGMELILFYIIFKAQTNETTLFIIVAFFVLFILVIVFVAVSYIIMTKASMAFTLLYIYARDKYFGADKENEKGESSASGEAAEDMYISDK